MNTYTNDSIEKGIMENDLSKIREAIGTICYTDRTFQNGEFMGAINYVMKVKHIDLLELYDGAGLISQQKTRYTDEDFGNAVFDLKENFSKERIQDVIRIGKKLYGNQRDEFAKNESEMNANPIKMGNKMSDATISPNQSSHQKKKTVIPIAIVILVAIIGVVLLLIKHN